MFSFAVICNPTITILVNVAWKTILICYVFSCFRDNILWYSNHTVTTIENSWNFLEFCSKISDGLTGVDIFTSTLSVEFEVLIYFFFHIARSHLELFIVFLIEINIKKKSRILNSKKAHLTRQRYMFCVHRKWKKYHFKHWWNIGNSVSIT